MGCEEMGRQREGSFWEGGGKGVEELQSGGRGAAGEWTGCAVVGGRGAGREQKGYGMVGGPGAERERRNCGVLGRRRGGSGGAE